MIIMEFDEIKKIWDTQNNEPMYVINEKGMHNRILSKKNQAGHVAGFSELLVIFSNTSAGTFVLAMDLFKGKGNIYMYLLTAWMLATALYVLVGRINRIKGSHRFDRSMRGDLDYAISTATYQVLLSRLMRWNIVPMAIFLTLGIWDGGKSIWVAATALVFFILAFYASGWEHNIYKVRKRELEILKGKLESEPLKTTDLY
jgi:hypothetical protein